MTNLVYEVEVGKNIEFNWITIDGTIWKMNGMIHREDGPAVERPDGTKEWYTDGNLHREDGPAIEYSDGGREWWLDGDLHREDGPAVEHADGTLEWYLDYVRYSKEGWKEELKRRNRSVKLTVAEICDKLGVDNLEIIKG